MNSNKLMAVAVIAAAGAAAATELREDPSVGAVNRLPARAVTIPCESEELAIDILQMVRPKSDSRWVQSLNGTWDFAWKSATAVADWERTAFKYRNPVGRYSTSFKRPWRWWFRRTILHFDGVSSAFRVRVNGQDVGYGEDSRLPSEFDLTPYLKIFGSNTLEVEVYRHSDGTCLEDQDFWRLSGIFRDAYLVSESKSAPFDIVVETQLSDDLKSGRFIVRDEKGNELKVRDVPNVRLWSSEYPYVYLTPLENKWGWWIFGGTDYRAVTFGFRKLEIRDSVLYLNGKRLLVKGVNRHELEPASGYAVTDAGMRRDLELLKAYNINAVRTCHYPDAPAWYDLCDREGIMVCCEANAERGARMVKFYRNHPSIICWPKGNESGDNMDIMSAIRGGFVRDFADQALWKTDERGKWLAYGGDFGDRPNGGNFNCNGLFDALRNPHPGAMELKHAYQNIACEGFDFATGRVTVRNDFLFTTLDDVDCRWQSLRADGSVATNGTFTLEELEPGAREDLKLNGFCGDSIVLQFLRDDECIAWDGFAKPFVPRPAATTGTPVAQPPFKLNFWRAPTDNDRGWKMSEVCRVWREATASQQLPPGVKSDLRVTELGGGVRQVEWTLVVPPGLPPIPRVGLTFTVPKAEVVSWFGLGPWENYADRSTGAMLGVYRSTVGLVSGLADPSTGTIAYPADRLNPDNYIRPGEQGYRTGCRQLDVGGVRITALNAPFGFNVWPYPQTMLEGKAHQWELTTAEELTVNIDAVQMGVGGDNSRGARPHAPYQPGAGTYRLVFTLQKN